MGPEKRRAVHSQEWLANDPNSSAPPTGWPPTDTDYNKLVHSQEWLERDYSDVGAAANSTSWTKVGKFNPKPVKLNQSRLNEILRRLLDVEMVKPARQAVAGDGIRIGLSYKTNAFVYLEPYERVYYTSCV